MASPAARRSIGGNDAPTDWWVQAAKILLGLAGVADLPRSACHSMPSDCFSSSAEIVNEPRRMLGVEPRPRVHLIVQGSFGRRLVEHPANGIAGCVGQRLKRGRRLRLRHCVNGGVQARLDGHVAMVPTVRRRAKARRAR